MDIDIIKDVARTAGDAIMPHFKNGITSQEKSDGSPITKADRQANDIIITVLEKAFPQDSILSEEVPDTKERLQAKRVWIIDPLDGTREFIQGIDQFTVNIALVESGKPILGVIYAPAIKELYYAQKGKGAFLEKEGIVKQLHVSKNTWDKTRMLRSIFHPNPKVDAILDTLPFTSTTVGSSLKGCYLAAGKADVGVRLTRQKEWDVAPMFLLIEEAGGRVTNFSGEPIVFNKEEPLVIDYVISNGVEHERLVSLFAPLAPNLQTQ